MQKARLAMTVRSKNAHWKLTEIKARHWEAVTRAAGLGGATSLLAESAEQTPRVLELISREIPANFPAVVRERIFSGMQRKAKEVAAEL